MTDKGDETAAELADTARAVLRDLRRVVRGRETDLAAFDRKLASMRVVETARSRRTLARLERRREKLGAETEALHSIADDMQLLITWALALRDNTAAWERQAASPADVAAMREELADKDRALFELQEVVSILTGEGGDDVPVAARPTPRPRAARPPPAAAAVDVTEDAEALVIDEEDAVAASETVPPDGESPDAADATAARGAADDEPLTVDVPIEDGGDPQDGDDNVELQTGPVRDRDLGSYISVRRVSIDEADILGAPDDDSDAA